jgi:uncharacterized protein with HEPN domain
MNERDVNLLLNIIDEIDVLLEMTDGYDLEHFLRDEKTKRAVSMSLINIGESVKSISDNFKLAHQDIEWRDIAALRDIAAHNYSGLYMERIFEIVKRDAPELLEQVKHILNAEGVEEEGDV